MGRAVGVRSRQLLAGSYPGCRSRSLALTLCRWAWLPLNTQPVWDIIFRFCCQGQFGLSKNQSVGPGCWYVANSRLKVGRAQAWEEDPLGPRADRGPEHEPSRHLELLLSSSPFATTHACDDLLSLCCTSLTAPKGRSHIQVCSPL